MSFVNDLSGRSDSLWWFITITRALLDLTSFTSFVTDCLAQRFQLRHQYRHMHISGITGHSGSRGTVNFKVSPRSCRAEVMAVEALFLPKVTTNVPSTSVSFYNNWKHFSNIQLADPDFGTPGNINLIPGANVQPCNTLQPTVHATKIILCVQDGFRMGLG